MGLLASLLLLLLLLVAGIGLLVGRAVRTVPASPTARTRDGGLSYGRALSLLAGVVTLVWPTVAILVLAILVGVRTLVLGAVEAGFALALRRLEGELS